MQVKATAFLARQDLIVKTFGEERWKEFLGRQAEKEPFWKDPVSATGPVCWWIPLDLTRNVQYNQSERTTRC